MRLIEFKSGQQETVRGWLNEPSTPRPHPAIIFAHGFLSTHDEFGDYPQRFCERGYLTLAFDFRGHGASEGMRGLVSEDRLVEDLLHALDYIEFNPGIDNNRIALFGHSLGGGAVLCATVRDARVRAVVAGAVVGRLRDELSNNELSLYRFIDRFNTWQKNFTHRSFYVPYRVSYKDIFADVECRREAERKGFLQGALPADNIPLLMQQDAITCAGNVRVPALIVQGELDKVVKHTSVRAVFDALPGEKELYEVKGSGHSVWTDCKGNEAYEHIAVWMDKYLRS